jgi:hypothetical protein
MNQAARFGLGVTGAFCLCGILLAGGCGGKGVVKGKVLYQGKPVRGGSVSFVLERGGTMFSPIEEDGSYTIPGVPPGTAKITVETDSVRPSVMQRDASGGPPEFMKKYIQEKEPQALEQRSKRYVRIPPQYSDPDKSNLSYVVNSGQQEHDIDLK